MCLTLVMLTATACVQLDEAINSRDLECGEVPVPDDVCVRLANDIVGKWSSSGFPVVAEAGPIVKVTVAPGHCVNVKRPDPAVARCWTVDASTAALADGSHRGGLVWTYYQTDDGRVFDQDGVAVED